MCMGAVRRNFWIALPGSVVKASREQLRPAAREERHVWRLVEAELRTKLVNFTHTSPSRHKMGLSANHVNRETRFWCVQASCVKHSSLLPSRQGSLSLMPRAAGVEVTQAESRKHVDNGWSSQGSELGAGTFGVGHVHVRHFSVPHVLRGKLGHKHSAVSQQSASSTAKACLTS